MSKSQGKLLIVDDNRELLAALKMFLSRHFQSVRTERNPNLIPAILNKEPFDMILLDMNFKAGANSGNEGIYWMRQIHELDPDITVVFITAYGDVDLAVRSMKEGAVDFIQKSWDEEKILSTILSAYKLHQSRIEINKLRNRQDHLSQELGNRQQVYRCQSEPMQRIYEMIGKVAGTDANILITGENGTGKEMIAREVHHQSRRKDEIFLNLDLGAIPETLFESELFGHVKGAFTDARQHRSGKFEAATGGTLFLDEIGNLPYPLQSKLLSTLQNRSVIRVGSNKAIPVDIRLISATNQPLFDMVEDNRFREDLLYRINTIQIDIPPLRTRPDDIPGLARFFLDRFADKYGKAGLKLTDTTLRQMQAYHWPGNIRELQHALEKAVILSEGLNIDPAQLLPAQNPSSLKNPNTYNLEENEKQIIAQALEQFRGNISLTAEKLGINRSTLYSKIRKYDLQ
jgi:DNA-binding NtrC family response regulator